MTEVGIRALKQNASAVVAAAAAGDVVVITDHGRPVAQLSAIPAGRLDQLVASGRARAPRRTLDSLPAPDGGVGLSAELSRMREDERY